MATISAASATIILTMAFHSASRLRSCRSSRRHSSRRRSKSSMFTPPSVRLSCSPAPASCRRRYRSGAGAVRRSGCR
nr:MAG TPA: hypothetical protein [Caudoviricetes sp.]